MILVDAVTLCNDTSHDVMAHFSFNLTQEAPEFTARNTGFQSFACTAFFATSFCESVAIEMDVCKFLRQVLAVATEPYPLQQQLARRNTSHFSLMHTHTKKASEPSTGLL